MTSKLSKNGSKSPPIQKTTSQISKLGKCAEHVNGSSTNLNSKPGDTLTTQQAHYSGFMPAPDEVNPSLPQPSFNIYNIRSSRPATTPAYTFSVAPTMKQRKLPMRFYGPRRIGLHNGMRRFDADY